MPDHDNAYKNFFSHPAMVQDLLCGFVQEDWVALLDFSSLEKVNASYVTDDLRKREDDIIWRIRMKNGKDEEWLYIYLLLEFQSRVDKFMAVRIMSYIGLLYQDLIKSKQIKGKAKLPPVFPLVLYNGVRTWKAEREVANLIEPVPQSLAAYRPSLRYFLLDEGRVQEESLNQEGNAVARLIEIERATDPEALQPLLKKLMREFNAPHNREVRRGFIVWLNRSIFKRFEALDNLPEMDDLPEVQDVIEQRMRAWERKIMHRGRCEGIQLGKLEGKFEGKLEGKLEGKQEGQVQALRRLLVRRFGLLSVEIEKQITTANIVQIEAWFDAGIDAPNLEAVFSLRYDPPSPQR